MKLILLSSGSNNPYVNLAIEELAFYKIKNDTDSILFYTWINDRSVIIGYNQNPYVECDLTKMKKEGISLVRRKTGGGAVYHDLGNLNYTIIGNGKNVDKDRWNKIIIDALADSMIEASLSGRNDVIVGNRKISGSAYKNEENAYLQHGTMMVNVDLSAVKNYLTPEKSKLQKHGIKSVEQRVCNISEIVEGITTEVLEQALIKEAIKQYNEADIISIRAEEYIESREIQELANIYSSDSFLYRDYTYDSISDDRL